jgi:hypothetical protein
MNHFIFIVCTVGILLFSCESKNAVQSAASHSDTVSTGIVFPSAGKFHKMLARSNGTWTGAGTMQVSADAPPVDAGTSLLINTMAMDGLYQVSEIKGNTTPGTGTPWTGLRITGYDSERRVFTRAMIGDGTAQGVAMEGQWDEATKSITMPFKKMDLSTGKERILKEVYRLVDQDTEILEIYDTDSKTGKEFKMLSITWTRKK